MKQPRNARNSFCNGFSFSRSIWYSFHLHNVSKECDCIAFGPFGECLSEETFAALYFFFVNFCKCIKYNWNTSLNLFQQFSEMLWFLNLAIHSHKIIGLMDYWRNWCSVITRVCLYGGRHWQSIFMRESDHIDPPSLFTPGRARLSFMNRDRPVSPFAKKPEIFRIWSEKRYLPHLKMGVDQISYHLNGGGPTF